MRCPVIAIDGPGGSGKGEISRRVARRLGWHLLDSGALYRLVALEALRNDVAIDDAGRLATLASDLDVSFSQAADGSDVIRLDGHDVAEEIRSEACGSVASQIAPLAPVREALLGLQRSFQQPPGLVADGRDMGSIVFPGAELKIFLTASAEERARRRYKQLKEKGIDVSLAALSAELAERDRRDAERQVAPLKPAPGAQILDTTRLNIEETVAEVLRLAAGNRLSAN
ncbi:MAG: (d)CMP kinase [Gammaproteobacteria bacterium]